MSPSASEPVTGRYDWTGPEMQDTSKWTIQLEPDHLAELQAAVADAQSKQLALTDITMDTYRLESLQGSIAAVLDELVDGRGFVLMRGLPVFDMTVEQSELAYWILGTHIGIPLPQNANGDVLVHVRDQGKDYSDPEVRGYQTTATLDYHVDGSDVVALLCRRTAKSGGASRIVSSAAVHNEMLRRDPELTAELYKPLAFDLRLPLGAPGKAFYTSPIFSVYEGRLSARYGRSYIESSQRHDDAPRMTDRTIAALDLFDQVTNDPALYLDMDFQPGDIQFLNNHVILHARNEYEDFPEEDLKRDLVRFWVSLRQYHALSPEYDAGSVGDSSKTASYA